MKTAERIYGVLLTLYPRGYREAFGPEMMQTFLDHYEDVARSGGHVGSGFWLSALTDEIKNIARQHRASLTTAGDLSKVSTTASVVSALLFVPLCAVFYAALVTVSLAVPHPPVSGVGVVVTLSGLLFLSAVLSAVSSSALAGALVRAFTRSAARTV